MPFRLILILFSFYTLQSLGQWNPTGTINTPIDAEEIIELNGVYFVTCQNNVGIYRVNHKTTYVSYDTLQTWETSPVGNLNHSVVIGDTIYAIMRDFETLDGFALNKIYRDGGDWMITNISYAPNPHANYVGYTYNTFEFYVKDGLFWIVSEGGLYYFEAGEWISPTATETNYPTLTSYVGDEIEGINTVYTPFCKSASQNDEYVYATSYLGIVRSLPSETYDWEILSNGILPEKSTAVFANGTTILSGIKNQIYRSTTNGDEWELAFNIEEGHFVNDFFINDDSIFALTTTGVYLSTDNGLTWIEKNTGLSSGTNVKSMIYSNEEYIIAAENGVYKDLENWIRVDNIQTATVDQLEKNATVIIAKTRRRYREVDNWGWLVLNGFEHRFKLKNDLWISNDEGDSWINSTEMLPVRRIGEVVELGNRFYVSAMPDEDWPPNQSIYVSDENGENWEEISTIPCNGKVCNLRVYGESTLAAYTVLEKYHPNTLWEHHLYISEDAGLSWRVAENLWGNGGKQGNSFKDVLINGDDIYLIIGGSLYKSPDLGVTWDAAGVGITATPGILTQFFYNASNEEFFTPVEVNPVFYPEDLLFSSTDWGESLDQTASYGQNGLILDMTFNGPDMYATTKNRVYYSSDNANSWENFSFGLPFSNFNDAPISSVLVKDGILYFGSNNFGVWKLPIGEVLLSLDTETNPELNVYPNPCNTQTTLHFGQDLSANHSVVIYDIAGKEVYRQENVSGNKLVISVEEMGKGMYFVILTDENSEKISSSRLVVE